MSAWEIGVGRRVVRELFGATPPKVTPTGVTCGEMTAIGKLEEVVIEGLEGTFWRELRIAPPDGPPVGTDI